MKLRHEWKHEISYSDLLMLRSRLQAVMRLDSHAVNGSYEIRSLYFDNLQDKALLEKVNGVNCREKFRIRFYNSDTSLILLEKKSKINGLCRKIQEPLSIKEANQLALNDCCSLKNSEKELLRELCVKMVTENLRARTIVDYTREPYVYDVGNVRVTLDYNIRAGIRCTDFLNTNCMTVPSESPIILEVKWDEFLPSVIRDIVQLNGIHTSSYSKYAACRIYG